MSILDTILRRAPARKLAPAIVEQVFAVVEAVVERVRDRQEARERLARRARAGDLDFLLDAVESDRRKAEDYVRGG